MNRAVSEPFRALVLARLVAKYVCQRQKRDLSI